MLNIEDYTDSNGLFDGRYRLVRLLSAAGGTADVWLAEDTDTSDQKLAGDNGDEAVRVEGSGVLVAIKIYRPKNVLDLEGELTFKRQFKTVYNCHHENLLTPTGYAVRRGLPYLVMPYCPKGSAEQLIGKPLSKDELWRLVCHVASGLAYLHACDPPIIHQDIKPDNILIDDNGYYCITDFGISVKGGAADLDDDDANGGTTAYMPPERFAEGYEPVAASDVWSLGATVYELVTGDVPFGSRGGALQMEGAKVPEIKADIPKELKRLVRACLDSDPAKRPTAAQIAVTARTGGRGRKWLRVAVPAVAVLLIAGAAWWRMAATDPADRFTRLCDSADSIVRIEKDNARLARPVEATASLKHLRRAARLYGVACAEKVEEGNAAERARQDSAAQRLRVIEGLYPLFDRYRGISDTLAVAREDDMPEQTKLFTDKRDMTSDIIKRIIKDL